jgi:proline iminopeptidase
MVAQGRAATGWKNFPGKTDWTVGPAHYQGVNFPTMLLWGSEVGHFPFLENKEDLRKSIDTYLNRYDL